MQDSVSELVLKFYSNTTITTTSIPEVQKHGFVLAYIGFTLLICLTVGGNTFVLLAIYLDKRLHSTSFYLIANMAVADLLLGIAVLPFSSVLEILHGKWIFGTSFCTAWLAIDVLCCTASINALMAISVDRYIGVTRPLIYSQIMTIKRTIILIVIVWAASTLTSVVPLFGLTYRPPKQSQSLINNMTSNSSSQHDSPQYICEVNKNTFYTILSSLISFYIPVLILLILYSRVYQEAKEQSKKLENEKRRLYNIDYQIASSQAQMVKPHCLTLDNANHTHQKLINNKKQKEQQEEQRRLSAQTIRFSLNDGEQTKSLLDNNNSNNNNNGLQEHDGDDESIQRTVTGVEGKNMQREFKASRPIIKRSTSTETSNSNSFPHQFATASRLIGKRLSTTLIRSSNNHSSIPPSDELLIIKRKLHNLRREKKAFHTLGLILGALLICWLPFFVTLPTIAILKANRINVNDTWFKITFWMGYCNSALNPFVYAFSNRAIRRSFQHILFRKICCCYYKTKFLCQRKPQEYSTSTQNNSIVTQISTNTIRRDSSFTNEYISTKKPNGILTTVTSLPSNQQNHVSFAEMLTEGNGGHPNETHDISHKSNHESLLTAPTQSIETKKNHLKNVLYRHVKE
ncbi:unnamed protein product [Didymodactylos carnosus]|uniref:G-protein coupled receptors family 1 profile domain-containing protein n=1 Tax=Didymodactylos carnosus TaxID=1234261 RepID=A0A8S2E7T0_9BILA|nr:unnamed protein product [Didymodactylos carnosus]CAF3965911.1 unnamed protein product [Didymodactylos carnosus]